MSTENHPIFMKFGTQQHILILRQSDDQIRKFLKFKMVDGYHFKNRFLAITQQLICPVAVKFCIGKQNIMVIEIMRHNLKILKIQDGGRPPYCKLLNLYTSAKNRPILTNFDIQMQSWKSMTVTWPNTKNFKIQNFKLKMVDGRRFKNRFLTITRQPIVRFQWRLAQGCRSTIAWWQKSGEI